MDSGLFLLLALGIVFLAVFLLVFHWFPDKQLSDAGKRAGAEEVREWSEDVTLIKWFYPFVRILQPGVERLPFQEYKNRLNRWVVQAGLERATSGTEIFALQIVLAIFFPVLFAKVVSSGLLFAGCFVLGFFFPFLWLFEKKKKRQEAIIISFPNIVDMLALTVEAGADFNSAIVRLCEQYKGKKEPIIDEFVIFQQNIRLGMTRDDALKKMAERVDLQDIYSFSSILIQADKMGASIARILKEQSNKLRKERMLRAEKMGAEASQKLMIPMVLFIFPLLFFVVLGPYILSFIYGK